LIKIKELPQIKVRITNRDQFLSEFSEVREGIPGNLEAKKLILNLNSPGVLSGSPETRKIGS
jgi:hypothetical protein